MASKIVNHFEKSMRLGQVMPKLCKFLAMFYAIWTICVNISRVAKIQPYLWFDVLSATFDGDVSTSPDPNFGKIQRQLENKRKTLFNEIYCPQKSRYYTLYDPTWPLSMHFHNLSFDKVTTNPYLTSETLHFPLSELSL